MLGSYHNVPIVGNQAWESRLGHLGNQAWVSRLGHLSNWAWMTWAWTTWSQCTKWFQFFS